MDIQVNGKYSAKFVVVNRLSTGEEITGNTLEVTKAVEGVAIQVIGINGIGGPFIILDNDAVRELRSILFEMQD